MSLCPTASNTRHFSLATKLITISFPALRWNTERLVRKQSAHQSSHRCGVDDKLRFVFFIWRKHNQTFLHLPCPYVYLMPTVRAPECVRASSAFMPCRTQTSQSLEAQQGPGTPMLFTILIKKKRFSSVLLPQRTPGVTKQALTFNTTEPVFTELCASLWLNKVENKTSHKIMKHQHLL